MLHKNNTILLAIRRFSTLMLAFCATISYAQDKPKGVLSGNLQLNYNFYQRDTAIGAANNPLYDQLLSGGQSWLNLNYVQGTFEVGARLDAFLNSNLHNPTSPYTQQGLGLFFIKKQIDKLSITGGHFYDQYGSGAIFRAYEDRSLGIDNAMFGINAAYQFNADWRLKAMVGRQKNLFTFHNPVITGANLEGSIPIKDKLFLTPGVSVLNRTLDATNMNSIVTTINTLPLAQRFVPKYNTFAFQGYNTLQYKNWNLYTEYNYKTKEAINDQNGNLIDRDGSMLFATLGYSQKGFGVTAQYKRTKDFILRTSPNERLLRGMIAFLPPVSRVNSLRLPARYVAASQELSEQSFQADLVISPKEELSFNTNFSRNMDLNNKLLFQEFYQDVTYNKGKNEIVGGVQFVDYNQDFYQQKPNYPNVKTFTPFVEYTYRIDRKKSLRAEAQYLFTDRDHQIFPFLFKTKTPAEKQDLGDWAFLLLEYSIAPKWSIAVSDMYNTKPTHGEGHHYPTVFASYTHKTTRFTATYTKQVEGVVCTGGVCRFEPAFSGAKIGMTTSW
jgi:hypothetical protein